MVAAADSLVLSCFSAVVLRSWNSSHLTSPDHETMSVVSDINISDSVDDTSVEDSVSEKLVLAQLIWSSTNLIIIFLYWTYLLYASISR